MSFWPWPSSNSTVLSTSIFKDKSCSSIFLACLWIPQCSHIKTLLSSKHHQHYIVNQMYLNNLKEQYYNLAFRLTLSNALNISSLTLPLKAMKETSQQFLLSKKLNISVLQKLDDITTTLLYLTTSTPWPPKASRSVSSSELTISGINHTVSNKQTNIQW